MNLLIDGNILVYYFLGSPFNVKVGGEPSPRLTERITRHREAADVMHIGSQCELSLKIPGLLTILTLCKV